MTKKYLHIEIIHGQPYVYRDNKKHRGKLITGNDIDNECRIDAKHVVLNINDLMSDVRSDNDRK